MSTPRHFIMATAGHVDHGKSSLVKALTGTDPDRLPEEKARGITIELGFAHLLLTTREGVQFDIGIVDVPGHEDFVKNMVAGVGSVDLALFVIAADDGWMPQTEEHLQILTYLGAKRAVVALTKVDLAPDEDRVAAEILRKLEGTPFENTVLVPTSIVTGRGLDLLREAIASALNETPLPANAAKPRLSVDRVFSLKGIGTVVTGSLVGGILEKNQTVTIQPAGLPARIRSIQSHDREINAAQPGTRTALCLPDLPQRLGSEKGIARGDLVAGVPLGSASKCLDVLLWRSARPIEGRTTKPLKDGLPVRWHYGASTFPAHLHLLDREPLALGQEAIAELRFDEPVFALAGERFILRDWAEQMTLGGGIVLDPNADRRNFRKDTQVRFLKTRAQKDPFLTNCLLSQLERDQAVPLETLLLQSVFSSEEISGGIAEFVRDGKACLAGDHLLEKGFWNNLRAEAADLIAAEHRAHPELPGLALDVFRSKLEAKAISPKVLELLEADLCQSEYVRTKTFIGRATHRPNLPPNLQAAGERIRAALAAKPLEPPSRKELAPDALTQQALRFLIQSGEAVEIGPDLVLFKSAFDQAVSQAKAFLGANGKATAGELRQALGSSRRVVIPLLEKFDQLGVTRRDGDVRKLR